MAIAMIIFLYLLPFSPSEVTEVLLFVIAAKNS